MSQLYGVTSKNINRQRSPIHQKSQKVTLQAQDRLQEKQPIDSAYHFRGNLVFKQKFLMLLIEDVTRCNHQTCREAFVRIYYISHKFCSIKGKTDEIIIVLKYFFPLWH